MKLKFLFLTLIILTLSFSVAYANDAPFVVSVNGQLFKNEETVVLKDGTLYGQFDDWASRFDLTTEWVEETKSAILYLGEDVYGFKPNSETVMQNEQQVAMRATTFTRNNRLYVPLYYLAEVMGMQIEWDSKMSELKLTTVVPVLEPHEIRKTLAYTDTDLIWLARIVEMEARGGSIDKKTAVANVVLNRVKSPNFGNTIQEVIFAKGQFTPARKINFKTLVPSEESILAAKRALNGVEIAKDCLYFNNRPFAWISPSRLYKVIEGDYFYR